MSDGIVFQVETTRVLQILAREIYDSPLALLRENVQNAYDAVRERFAHAGKLTDGGRIDISIDQGVISITDNGIGMDEVALRENFWKAGSSGKHSERARQAGVVGTFGIGAMANFGVCTTLMVETRAEGSSEVLLSVAMRDSLEIAKECITLERVARDREIGTTVTAYLGDEHPISLKQAIQYLEPYVSLLPVPVFVNGSKISGSTFESRLPLSGRRFDPLASQVIEDGPFSGVFEVFADPNGQILVLVKEITLGGNTVEGKLALLQAGGPLMGLRSYFGLAPIPAIGNYQFGGFVNLSFLQPTAGREALSRESINLVTSLIAIAERAASESLATSPLADKNNAFLQWLASHGRFDLALNVSVHVLPEQKDVAFKELKSYIGARTAHYYTGTDRHIMTTFANEEAYLLQIAQGNPRRKVQLHYVTNILIMMQVPDSAQITRAYKGTELSAPEASVILKTASILRDDYLISDVEIMLAEISHGVTVLSNKTGEQLKIYIARSSSLLPPLIEFHGKAYRSFHAVYEGFCQSPYLSKNPTIRALFDPGWCRCST